MKCNTRKSHEKLLLKIYTGRDDDDDDDGQVAVKWMTGGEKLLENFKKFMSENF